MADYLTRQEEDDAQKYIEDLLGLRDTYRGKEGWQQNLDKAAMTTFALGKAFDIGKDKEKLSAALSGLPYQSRYGYSDFRDIQKRLLGKYPHINIDKILRAFVKDDKGRSLGLKDFGGEGAMYISMMKHSPSTLEPKEMFNFWKKNPQSELVGNALMDLEYKGL